MLVEIKTVNKEEVTVVTRILMLRRRLKRDTTMC